jgi:hypothetical protein
VCTVMFPSDPLGPMLTIHKRCPLEKVNNKGKHSGGESVRVLRGSGGGGPVGLPFMVML